MGRRGLDRDGEGNSRKEKVLTQKAVKRMPLVTVQRHLERLYSSLETLQHDFYDADAEIMERVAKGFLGGDGEGDSSLSAFAGYDAGVFGDDELEGVEGSQEDDELGRRGSADILIEMDRVRDQILLLEEHELQLLKESAKHGVAAKKPYRLVQLERLYPGFSRAYARTHARDNVRALTQMEMDPGRDTLALEKDVNATAREMREIHEWYISHGISFKAA